MFYILIFLLLLKTINSKSYLVELSANKWSDGKSHLKKLEEDFDKRLAENEKEGALKEFPEESRATKDYMSIREGENLGCKGTILQSSYYLCATFRIHANQVHFKCKSFQPKILGRFYFKKFKILNFACSQVFGLNGNFNGKMTKNNKMAKNHFSGVQNGSQSD